MDVLRVFLKVDKLEAKVYKPNTMHSLLKIDKIEWNKLETYFIENKSDSLLSIGKYISVIIKIQLIYIVLIIISRDKKIILL